MASDIWNPETWRESSGEKSDLLREIRTWQQNSSSMSGLAAFYDAVDSEDPLPIDLYLQSADFSFREHFQVNPYVGDIFELRTLGAAPMEANLSFLLVGDDDTRGKSALMDAYTGILRLEACAERKKLPLLLMPSICLTGPITRMRISDSSDSADTRTVNMVMLVLGLQLTTGDGIISFDYQHGHPSSPVPGAAEEETGRPPQEGSSPEEPHGTTPIPTYGPWLV